MCFGRELQVKAGDEGMDGHATVLRAQVYAGDLWRIVGCMEKNTVTVGPTPHAVGCLSAAGTMRRLHRVSATVDERGWIRGEISRRFENGCRASGTTYRGT